MSPLSWVRSLVPAAGVRVAVDLSADAEHGYPLVEPLSRRTRAARSGTVRMLADPGVLYPERAVLPVSQWSGWLVCILQADRVVDLVALRSLEPVARLVCSAGGSEAVVRSPGGEEYRCEFR